MSYRYKDGWLSHHYCSLQSNEASDRTNKAISCAKAAPAAPLNMAKKNKATVGKVLPSYTFGTNWSTPSLALSTRLRSQILKCIWGNQSKMRCPEIVLGLLNDPTRVDHFYASAFRAFIDARRMLRKS